MVEPINPKCSVIHAFCIYYSYQRDRNNEVAIEYCNHNDNPHDFEGNCTRELCPLIKE